MRKTATTIPRIVGIRERTRREMKESIGVRRQT
jgi:hypothetical protein